MTLNEGQVLLLFEKVIALILSLPIGHNLSTNKHTYTYPHILYTHCLVHNCRQMDTRFCTVQYRQRSCGVTDMDLSQAIPQLFLSVPVLVPVEQTLGRIRSPSPMTIALLTIAVI